MAQRDSGYARIHRDAYMTPAWVTELLASWLAAHVHDERPGEPRLMHVWEPAAGTGQMVGVLRHRGYTVTASDIHPGDGLAFQHDFLSLANPPLDLTGVDAIFTNPPYADADRFVRQAVKLMQRDGIVAMLLPVKWDSAKSRRDLFGDCPAFRAKLVLTDRIVWFEAPKEEGKRNQGPSENHAWFVWDHRHCGRPELHYLTKPKGAHAREIAARVVADPQIETSAPDRPVMRYHGGKWRLAPWVLAHFPPHKVYVEPYGGAASVLLQKPRLPAEVYNDLDGSVVNVFRVLRDPAAARELHRRLRLTPFARQVLDWSYEAPTDDIDAAHKIIARSFMGHGSDSVTRTCRTGFRSKMTNTRGMPAQAWASQVDAIPAFTARLQGVTIEHRPALEVMQRLDGPDTLHYCDPPYVTATRSAISGGRGKTHGYAHEMTDAQHREMAAALHDIEGMVVLSGYRSALYDELFGDWERVEAQAMADGAKARTECLWFNPKAARLRPQGQLL